MSAYKIKKVTKVEEVYVTIYDLGDQQDQIRLFYDLYYSGDYRGEIERMRQEMGVKAPR